MKQESIGEITQVFHVNRLDVFLDYVFEDEPPNDLTPSVQFFHVPAVDWQEPWHEVDGVSLIYFPEDFIEQSNRFLEVGVVVAKARTAHILREYVGTRSHQNRFQIDRL